MKSATSLNSSNILTTVSRPTGLRRSTPRLTPRSARTPTSQTLMPPTGRGPTTGRQSPRSTGSPRSVVSRESRMSRPRLQSTKHLLKWATCQEGFVKKKCVSTSGIGWSARIWARFHCMSFVMGFQGFIIFSLVSLLMVFFAPEQVMDYTSSSNISPKIQKN